MDPPVRKRWRDREGDYELLVPAHRSTTRQGEILNLALASQPTPHQRTLLGRDRVTRQVVGEDPFDSYNDPNEDTSNVTVAVLGDVGRGKSSLMKCQFGTRQILRGRYVVVIDKKLQGTEGEYAPLARELGTEPIRFTMDGTGSRINILDPNIGLRLDQTGPETHDMPTGQMRLIRAVLASAMGRKLREVEGKAVRIALVAAHRHAKQQQRDPILADLITAIASPTADDCAAVNIEPDLMRQWGYECGAALERMVEEDLRGLVDGPTSPEVALDHPSRLTVFDISALPTTGPSLKIVMLLIQVWMSNLLSDRSARKQQTVNIVEEGWHVTDDPEIGQIFKENAKLHRGSGMCTVTGFHHPSDTPLESPARALLQEAGFLFIFGQANGKDVEETLRLRRLDPSYRERLANMAQGECLLLRPGRDPIWVKLDRSRWETGLTNTDAQLGGTPDAEQDVLAAVLAGR